MTAPRVAASALRHAREFGWPLDEAADVAGIDAQYVAQAGEIEGAAALTKYIDSIASKGKKLDGEIQVSALSAAHHFAQHGDVTYINRLFLALGKGARHAARTW